MAEFTGHWKMIQMVAHALSKMKQEDAEAYCADHGIKTRVVWKDGEALIATRDVQPNRINLHIKNGLVVMSLIG